MTKSKLKKEKKRDDQGVIRAKEIAEAMAANMAANQADPEFELTRESRNQEAAEYALKKNRKQLAAAGIHIPGEPEEPKEPEK